MLNTQEAGQWPRVAQIWQQLGSPLRPVAEDIGFCQLALEDWCRNAQGQAPRGLILGVTPELYHLAWPKNSRVKAVDRTPEMIQHVWPGDPADVVQSDWRHMSWPEASFDVVFCDGGVHLLAYPPEQAELSRELARCIAPGGLFVVRLFVPPARQERPEEVLDELLAGQIPNLNCLKLRLGMALQASPSAGVMLQEVWRSLHAVATDWPQLASKLGWPLEHLLAIDAYRESQARYHFITVEEAIALLCEGTEGAFELQHCYRPSYEMGSQCPSLVFRRSSAPHRPPNRHCA